MYIPSLFPIRFCSSTDFPLESPWTQIPYPWCRAPRFLPDGLWTWPVAMLAPSMKRSLYLLLPSFWDSAFSAGSSATSAKHLPHLLAHAVRPLRILDILKVFPSCHASNHISASTKRLRLLECQSCNPLPFYLPLSLWWPRACCLFTLLLTLSSWLYPLHNWVYEQMHILCSSNAQLFVLPDKISISMSIEIFWKRILIKIVWYDVDISGIDLRSKTIYSVEKQYKQTLQQTVVEHLDTQKEKKGARPPQLPPYTTINLK